MTWYYLNESSEVVGPVSEQALKELNAAGALATPAQVCREGTEEWVTLAEILGADALVDDTQPQDQPDVIPANSSARQPAKLQKKRTSLTVFVTLGVLAAVGAVVYSVLPDDKDEGKPASTTQRDVATEDPMNPTTSGGQWFLGHQYHQGWDGIPQDFENAEKWFRKSALQGDKMAQASLGQMYLKGEGVEVDHKESAQWWRYAAEQGMPIAQHRIGVLYLSGLAGEQDNILAYMWLNLAAAGDDEEIASGAQEVRTKLASQMTSSDIKEAQRLSREWKPKSFEKLLVASNEAQSNDPVLEDPDNLDFDPDEISPSDIFTNSIGMKFAKVNIPTGPTAGKTILFSVWETRKKDYLSYAESEPTWLSDSRWKTGDGQKGFAWSDDPNSPVTFVNHADVSSFCLWLTQRDQEQGFIPNHAEYRLPTDHEWSCAVGIGSSENSEHPAEEKNGVIKDIYPWGREWPPPADFGHIRIDGRKSRFDKGFAPAGSFRPGMFGLYDMAGNVSELVWDTNSPLNVKPSRGFSFLQVALKFPKEQFFSSTRMVFDRKSVTYDDTGQGRCSDLGFRCVLELDGTVSDLRNSNRILE